MASGERKRCEELWYQDGNVVLLAGDTLFRVDSGTLTEHSPFFKSLFTLPQPEDAEKFDGCPLVTLVGDRAEDVRILLLALLGRELNFSFTEDADATVRLLKLGHKYEISALKEHILPALERMFPTTLEGFMSPQRDSTKAFSDDKFASLWMDLEDEESTSQWEPPKDFSTLAARVKLANAAEYIAPHLLPALLARLMHSQFTLQHRDPDGAFRLEPLDEDLSPALKRSLLDARANLSDIALTQLYPTLFHVRGRSPFSPKVEPQYCCTSPRLKTIYSLLEWDGKIDPLRNLAPHSSFSHGMNRFPGFCGRCLGKLESDYDEGLVILWKKLPGTFGLGSWEALLEQGRL